MKPVKWVIRFVQAFLEQHGRVALKDPRNKRPAGGAATAYSRAEHALCRLQTLSGTRPRWAFENTELAAAACADVDLDRVRVLNFGKRKEAEPSRSSAEGKGGWTAGTGYGHGGTEGGPTWDVHATEKAAAQKDREMRVMWSALAAGAAEIAPQACHHHLLTLYIANLPTPSLPVPTFPPSKLLLRCSLARASCRCCGSCYITARSSTSDHTPRGARCTAPCSRSCRREFAEIHPRCDPRGVRCTMLLVVRA